MKLEVIHQNILVSAAQTDLMPVVWDQKLDYLPALRKDFTISLFIVIFYSYLYWLYWNML